MEESVQLVPKSERKICSTGFLWRCLSVLATPVVVVAKTAYAGVRFVSKKKKSLVEQYPNFFRVWTGAYEGMASISNAPYIAAVLDEVAGNVIDSTVEQFLGVSVWAWKRALPYTALCGIGAVLSHWTTNGNYSKNLQKNGPQSISTGRKIYIAVISTLDGLDHLNAYISSGKSGVQLIAGEGSSQAVKIGCDAIIVVGGAVASVSEVRICVKNMLEYYSGAEGRDGGDNKADFFTKFTLVWGILMSASNALSFGKSLSLITRITHPAFVYTTSATLGAWVSAGSLATHFGEATAFQADSCGHRETNDVELTVVSKALIQGDRTNHWLTYTGPILQIFHKALQSGNIPFAAFLLTDLSVMLAADIAIQSETLICKEEGKEFFRDLGRRRYTLFGKILPPIQERKFEQIRPLLERRLRGEEEETPCCQSLLLGYR